MLTEEKIVRDYVGTPLMVQIGFCKAAELGFNRALRKQLARGAKKNGINHQNDTAILLAAAQATATSWTRRTITCTHVTSSYHRGCELNPGDTHGDDDDADNINLITRATQSTATGW